MVIVPSAGAPADAHHPEEVRTAVAFVRRSLSHDLSLIVHGPAGIGKTTLVRRALHGLSYRVGQSLPALSGVAYHPLGHALGMRFVGSPTEVATAVIARLGDQTLWIEDVHWADGATREVLGSIAGRIPLVVTSREEASCSAPPGVATLRMPPLTRREAFRLARRLHPHLDDRARRALVDVACGIPLLLVDLPVGGTASWSLTDVLAGRIGALSDAERSELERLAVFGRPLSGDIVRTELGGGMLERIDGATWFTHGAVFDAVRKGLSAHRRRTAHQELATRCTDADAAAHHLALGERSIARARALRAAQSASPSELARLLLIAAEADGWASPLLLVRAAKALLEAHRPVEAEQVAERIVSGDAEIRTESAIVRAQSAWLTGDLQRAVDICAEMLAELHDRETGSAVRLRVEWTQALIRLRVGQPTNVSLAAETSAIADRTGVDRARARNLLGLSLSHSGQPGWWEHFSAAAEIARAEGDDEQECAAAYWEVSAYGFYGPIRSAVDLGARMLKHTAARGLTQWHRLFRGAYSLHGLGIQGGSDEDLANAEQLLVDDPLFRNRAQVELAIGCGMIDRGRIEEARRVIAGGRAVARTNEDRSILCVLECELAWATGDLALLDAALCALENLDTGFFGLNAAAESAAIHALGRHSWIRDVPQMTNRLTTSLDVVNVERRARLQLQGGHHRLASATFSEAADKWFARDFHRSGLRALISAAQVAFDDGRIDVAERFANDAQNVLLTHRFDSHGAILDRLQASISGQRCTVLLTGREIEILTLVGQGLTSRRIAEDLSVSVATVDTHVGSAIRKLGVASRSQAAADVARAR